MLDEPCLGMLVGDASEGDSLVGEYLAEVLFERLLRVIQDAEDLSLVAESKVQHAPAQETVDGSLLYLLLQDGGVPCAGILEAEFPCDLATHEVFYLDAVLGAGIQGGVYKVPVPGGVRLFGPEQFGADLEHIAVAQSVLYLVIDFLLAVPQGEPADGHGVFFGVAAVVGNLYCEVGLLLFPARVFHAALVQGFGACDGNIILLPDGHPENLGIQGVAAVDAYTAGRNHVVLALTDFKMQVGVPDSGTPGEGQRVALLVGEARFQDDVVALFAVLFRENETVQLAEAALVGKNPGLSAFALVEHDLAIEEGGNPHFFYLAIFGSVDDPALFHEGGVVYAGVVAGAAVLTEGRSEVGIFLERRIDGLCGKADARKAKERNNDVGYAHGGKINNLHIYYKVIHVNFSILSIFFRR